MDTKYLDYIEENLHTAKGLVAGILIITSFCLLAIKLIDEIDSNIKLYIYAAMLLFWVLFWAKTRFWLPRSSKKNITIVLAIHSENKKDQLKLRNDFIIKLIQKLRLEDHSFSPKIIELPKHFIEKIVYSDDPYKTIHKMNQKIQAHMYVFGMVKKRKDGEEKYILSFNGYVSHKPITKELSGDIAKDFAQILPSEVIFPENQEIRGFDFTVNQTQVAIKYITGIAAFVSHAPLLALKLHQDLQTKLSNIPDMLKPIKKKLSSYISNEAYWCAFWYHIKEKDHQKALTNLNITLREDPHNYGALLMKARIIFILNNKDAVVSLSMVRQSGKFARNDNSWRFSEAFLLFWNKDYPQALKICQKIKRSGNIHHDFLSDIRDFNLEVLNKNQNRGQIYFWMGYLSYFLEKNLITALSDFENFEKYADIKDEEILFKKSTAYLVQIKNKMGLTQ